MKTLKRALCLLLTLTMLVGMFTMVASAEETTTEPTYTIVLHANNGTGATIVNKNMKAGDELSLAHNFTKAGYEFNGWSNSENGSVKIKATTAVSVKWTNFSTDLADGTLDLYAQWVEVEEPETEEPGNQQPGTQQPTIPSGSVSYEIEVIVDYNRGRANDTQTLRLPVYYVNGEVIGSSVSLPTPTREGYTFKNWTVNGRVYMGERLTASCVLMAQWTRNGSNNDHIFEGGCNHWYNGNHTVRYTDGVFAETIFRDQVYSVKHGAATPEFYGTPVRVGYKFNGWSPRVSYRVTECVVYTATWVKSYNNYTNYTNYGSQPTLTTQHIAYIQGDPDSEVRPLDAITRAEVAAVLYRLLSDRTLTEYRSYKNPFVDVAPEAWYNDAVSTLYNAGIITGNGGRFNPESPITRAELVAMLSRFSTEQWNGVCQFRDVNKYDWFYHQVGLASQLKLITGDEYGFRPNDIVLRCEAVTMINRALGRSNCAKAVDSTNWIDNPTGTWYYAAMVEAGNAH